MVHGSHCCSRQNDGGVDIDWGVVCAARGGNDGGVAVQETF